MNIYKKIIRTALICILGWSFFACDKMDATYREFLEGGEMIYPGKADSLRAYPGDYRIQLSWLLLADPSITSSKIYWNNGQDSAEVQVERTQGIDTVNILLTDMDERAYTFEVYNYDNEGNRSVSSELLGTVYGDVYRSSLLNRVIRNLSLIDDQLLVEWENAEDQSIGLEMTYTDNSGDTYHHFVPVNEDSTLLENYEISNDIGFQTLFLPDSLAIDTFKSTFEDINYEIVETEVEVDRSGFSLKDLPGDENTPNKSSNSVDRIWSNDYDIDATPFISKAWKDNDCENLVPFPYWFTIDMGSALKLTSFTLFQRSNSGDDLYNNSNLKKFEIWGAPEVDEQYNPKDHGGVFDDNWILLEECEIIRPEDESTWLAEAVKGHKFDLRVDGKAQKVRYLRIKAIDNWRPEDGPCEEVKKRTYINIAAIRLDAVQEVVQLK